MHGLVSAGHLGYVGAGLQFILRNEGPGGPAGAIPCDPISPLQTHVPDETFEQVKKHFSEKEIVDLTILGGLINAWNRLAISMRAVPGAYKAKHAATSTAAS